MLKEINIDGFIIDLNSKFGKGQSGELFRCYNPKFKKHLCVKILKIEIETLKMLQREVEILQTLLKLDSQFLVQILQINIEEGKFYIFMEYCQQGDLENAIKNKKNKNDIYTVQAILGILEQLVQGYKVLYDYRIIHRDIKPANILIGNNGFHQIADYGVSKIVEDPNKQQKQSSIGTPLYASPQVLLGEQYSNKCDVYSLGAVIYQLIFFQVPRQAYTLLQLNQMILKKMDIKLNMQDIPTNLGGSIQQKEKLLKFLNKSLIYEESSRISWNEIFQMFPSSSITSLFRFSTQDSNDVQMNLQAQTLIQRSDQVVSIIQYERNNQKLENNKNQKIKQMESEVLNSNITYLNTDHNVNYSTIQNLKLQQEQVIKDNLKKNDINQQNQVKRIIIKVIDNNIKQILEFYFAKFSFAETLFMQNERFVEYLNNNNHLVNCRQQISCLYLFQILLSGYQFSIIFNIYHLVQSGENYIENLQITKELNLMNRQILELQINQFLNDQTENQKTYLLYIKKLYLKQKLVFKKQCQEISNYQAKYNINFKLEEIIGDQNSNEIFFSPKLYYNQYKLKFNEFYHNFEIQSNSLEELKRIHLAISINYFNIEEKYQNLTQILDFDYKQILQFPDDKQIMEQIIFNYFNNFQKKIN